MTQKRFNSLSAIGIAVTVLTTACGGGGIGQYSIIYEDSAGNIKRSNASENGNDIAATLAIGQWLAFSGDRQTIAYANPWRASPDSSGPICASLCFNNTSGTAEEVATISANYAVGLALNSNGSKVAYWERVSRFAADTTEIVRLVVRERSSGSESAFDTTEETYINETISVQFAPDDSYVAVVRPVVRDVTSSMVNGLQIHFLDQSQPISISPNELNASILPEIKFCPDSSCVYFISNSSLRRLDIASKSVEVLGPAFSTFDISEDGDTILLPVRTGIGEVAVGTYTAEEIELLLEPVVAVKLLQYTPDGNYVWYDGPGSYAAFNTNRNSDDDRLLGGARFALSPVALDVLTFRVVD